MRTMLNPACRREILDRLRRLSEDSTARWGRMSAPQMIVHLSDQMRHTLGDSPCPPRKSLLGLPVIRYAAIYLLPWPKGRLKGPPEAFETQPTDWEADVQMLEKLIDRFAARDPRGQWPPHALLGPMSGRAWGVFCFKHFDHHLRQFGQ